MLLDDALHDRQPQAHPGMRWRGNLGSSAIGVADFMISGCQPNEWFEHVLPLLSRNT
jgi:hypothetical protein